MGMIGMAKTAGAFAVAAFLGVASAGAQDAQPPGPSGAPQREGNIYDHKAHQPTQADVDAAGLPAATDRSRQNVEQSVDDLLRQTDSLDKQQEQDLSGASNRPRLMSAASPARSSPSSAAMAR